MKLRAGKKKAFPCTTPNGESWLSGGIGRCMDYNFAGIPIHLPPSSKAPQEHLSGQMCRCKPMLTTHYRPPAPPMLASVCGNFECLVHNSHIAIIGDDWVPHDIADVFALVESTLGCNECPSAACNSQPTCIAFGDRLPGIRWSRWLCVPIDATQNIEK
jgi:hypothetical protein